MPASDSQTFDLAWGLPEGTWTPDQTIRPSLPSETSTLPPLDLGEWSPLADDGGADLVVRETLGAGGMGAVYLARQQSLDRVVAIKRAPRDKPRLAAALIREARFLGRLAHPNVVPVYAVGSDQDGAPAVVMKHVAGRTWKALLQAGETELDRHLEILEDVCKAVHFAHDRGVVHRDLKPSNVMVGAHGEVYLMDWGIAVDVGHRAERIAGTPAYLAPEQLEPDQPLTGRTDVFQLGACLYELLFGTPPFMATTAEASVAAARAGAPPMDGDAPAELLEVCRVAMARSPADRFPTASALRERLAWVRRHRASMELTHAATLRLDGLDALEPEQAERRFAEARFGFQQALETCPDNEQALAGLRRAQGRMVALRADRGDTDGARALLEELAEAGADTEALRALVDRSLAEQRRIRQAAAHADLGQGGAQRSRFFWGLALGTAACSTGWAGLVLAGVPLTGYAGAIGSMVVLVGAAWVGLWINRDWVLQTGANRALGLTIGLIGIAWVLWRVMAWSFDANMAVLFSVELLIIAIGSATASLALTPRLVPVSLIWVVGAVAIAAFPAGAIPLYAGFLGLGLVVAAAAWSRVQPT